MRSMFPAKLSLGVSAFLACCYSHCTEASECHHKRCFAVCEQGRSFDLLQRARTDLSGAISDDRPYRDTNVRLV